MDLVKQLRNALTKRTKTELIDVLVELGRADTRIFRQLDERFDLHHRPQELVAATKIAISDATDFDERDANQNFRYDSLAYETVQRNLSRLVALGQLRPAMELAVDLMKEGSHQVEMSDEGLMTEDIQDCLRVVLAALQKGGLPSGEVVAWCKQMLKADRMGFICDRELRALQEQCEAE